MNARGSQPATLAPLLVILLGLVVAFHLGNALAGRFLYRAQHLGAALEYSSGRIDLLRPVIPGFNATGTPTPQELPIWQAAAGLVFKLAHSNWYGWAIIVSLVFFAASIWPFLWLAQQYVGHRAAGWALACFLMQPLVIVYAGKAATDGFCLMVSLWFLFFADRLVQTGRWTWWPGLTLFACLSAISKLPFFMTAGLCSAGMLVVWRVRSWRRWAMLMSAGAVAAAVFVIWTRFCDACLAQGEYPYQDLRCGHNPFMVWWYFGDLHMRLDPRAWVKPVWRLLHGTLGALPMGIVLVAGVVAAGNRLAKLWLLAAVLVTLVFTNLVQIHWHYYLMFSPAVALLCGATFARWEELWGAGKRSGVMLVGGALVFSAVDGLTAMKLALDYDPYPQRMSELLRQHTKPEDRLLVYKCDPEWPGEILSRAGRKGLYVPTLEAHVRGSTNKGLYGLLNDEGDLRRLKNLGYNKLILISQSPVSFAAQAINPGGPSQRMLYPASIPSKAGDWPVSYRSEDMVIMDIPGVPAAPGQPTPSLR